jgi:hypothetical protein
MTKSRAIWISLIGAIQGGYMLFDGIHKATTGTYFGGRVGPWAYVVSSIGISPDSMAPVFIIVGALWVASAIGLLLGFGWARALVAALAIITLAYPLFGTLLAIIVLVLLFTGRSRFAAVEQKP